MSLSTHSTTFKMGETQICIKYTSCEEQKIWFIELIRDSEERADNIEHFNAIDWRIGFNDSTAAWGTVGEG